MRPVCIYFSDPKTLHEIADLLRDHVFDGIAFTAGNGIRDEVPALKLTKRIFGLHVVLSGYGDVDGYLLELLPSAYGDVDPAAEKFHEVVRNYLKANGAVINDD